METDPPENAPPENLQPGFQESPEHGFVLKLPFLDQASTALSFTGESVHHILDAKDKLAKIKAWEAGGLGRQVTLIGARKVGAYVLPVVLDVLFDAALAETLVALGDTDFKAASGAFLDAYEEPDLALKLRFRHTAEGALRQAYEKYTEAISQYRSTGRAQLGSEPVKDITAVHEKAARAALLIAATCYDAGSQTAATRWARLSRDHFTRHYDLSMQRAKNGIDLNELGQFTVAGAAIGGTLMSAGLGGIVFSLGGGLALFSRLEERIERHLGVINKLEKERDTLKSLWERFGASG